MLVIVSVPVSVTVSVLQVQVEALQEILLGPHHVLQVEVPLEVLLIIRLLPTAHHILQLTLQGM